MKTIVRYKCEVCGLEHVTKESVEACEACKPPPLPYKKGDEVIVKLRREDPKFCICCGTHLEAYIYGEHAAGENADGIAKSKRLNCWHPEEFHHWVIDIEEEIWHDDYPSSAVGVCWVMRRIRFHVPNWALATKQREHIDALAVELTYTDLIIDWDTLDDSGVNALIPWDDVKRHQKDFVKHGVECQILPIPKAKTK